MDLKLNAVVFLAVLSLLTGVNSQTFLKMPSDNSQSSHKISIGARKLIRMKTTEDPYCESWKFTVENNDAGAWMTPRRCVQFVKHYINGKRYLSDSEFVTAVSLTFAKNVTVNADGKDCWIFDIDETLLSNVPYYAVHGYGSEAYDSTAFDEWTELGVAPVLPASLSLYNKLKHLNFTIILLTGRSETYRNITVKNLHLAGYTKWDKLLLRGSSDEGTTAIVYKSKKRMELVAKGYRIHGSSGDQWSDLFGNATAVRSFKLPNPMYFIS